VPSGPYRKFLKPGATNCDRFMKLCRNMCNCGLCTQTEVKRFARLSATRMWIGLRLAVHVIVTESAIHLNHPRCGQARCATPLRNYGRVRMTSLQLAGSRLRGPPTSTYVHLASKSTLICVFRRHLKVHSYYDGPKLVAVAANACERDTKNMGIGVGVPQARILVSRKTPRGLKPKTGFRAIENRGRCRKVKLRRGDAGRWNCGDCSGL
jgi:hypothetical protein